MKPNFLTTKQVFVGMCAVMCIFLHWPENEGDKMNGAN